MMRHPFAATNALAAAHFHGAAPTCAIIGRYALNANNAPQLAALRGENAFVLYASTA